MVYLGWWRSYRFVWVMLPILLMLLSITTDVSTMARSASHPAAIDAGAIDADATLLLAVGDIANCEADDARHVETAALVDTLIGDSAVGDIALLGDIAYDAGSAEEFADCYDVAWGRHGARVRPVPGNHEYRTTGAEGYFTYFEAKASPDDPECRRDCAGYYAYDLGEWHIVALNSEASMTNGSPQEMWLRADLAANRSRCTLAYWHHPRFSSGAHGNDDRSADIWQTLYDFGVDIVLNGHEHNYERFAPQNPDGMLDAGRGIRVFVVGTGGAPLRNFGSVQANSEARNRDAWGVLQLALYNQHYTWTFKPIAGQTYIDSGSASCVTLAGDWEQSLFLPQVYESIN